MDNFSSEQESHILPLKSGANGVSDVDIPEKPLCIFKFAQLQNFQMSDFAKNSWALDSGALDMCAMWVVLYSYAQPFALFLLSDSPHKALQFPLWLWVGWHFLAHAHEFCCYNGPGILI